MNRHNIERTLWEEFFENSLSKGQERKIQIVEAAIFIIGKEGADVLTYDRLAERCKVTRQLIIHHFPDRTELIRWGARFVRAHMQNFAVTKLKQESSNPGQVIAYVKSTFDWVRAYPNYSGFCLYYYYCCSLKKDFKKLNSELVEMGHQRIEALIIAGVEAKVFRCATPKASAKVIQNIITGSLLSFMIEDYGDTKAQLESWTIESVGKILGTS